MRLKGRLKRLEREVHWLKYEGWLRSLEMQMKLLEQMDALVKHKAALKAKADAANSPRPEEPREARRLEGPASEKVLDPTLRDASLRDAPQGEVFVVGQGEAKGSPRPEEPRNARRLEGPGTGAVVDPGAPPHPYDPPEHMQIRPVTWRLRTAEDDWDDDDDDDVLGPYQTVTEYDPLDDD